MRSLSRLGKGPPLASFRDRIAAMRLVMPEEELSMSDETEDASEIKWHREQIEQNRATMKELEDGNTAGGEVFPETQSQIDILNKQIAQSELIVAAYDKKHPPEP